MCLSFIYMYILNKKPMFIHVISTGSVVSLCFVWYFSLLPLVHKIYIFIGIVTLKLSITNPPAYGLQKAKQSRAKKEENL